jgi:hypothetical protein
MKYRNSLCGISWIDSARDAWTDGWEGKIVCGVFTMMVATLLFFIVILWQWFAELSLKEGIVTNKGHIEEWIQTTYITMSIGEGTMMVPQTIVFPESWSVTIEGDDPEGVHKQRTISVSREFFEKIKTGEMLIVK